MKSTIHKTIITLLLIMSMSTLSASLFGQAPFVTVWSTSSSDTEITIPVNLSFDYNYEVDWDYDGITFNPDDTGVTGPVTHNYGSAQVVTIAIRGTFPAIFFNNGGDKAQLLNITSWGDIEWQTMNNAFYGCSNLASMGNDIPDLSDVKDMSGMFRDASVMTSIGSMIPSWDVSTVKGMSYMFSGAQNFNGNINTWNVSSVIDMSYMFTNAESFNQSLNSWITSSVTNMSAMFMGAERFNGLIDMWNVSSVTNMSNMFNGAAVFNQSINNWDVGMVTNMVSMFEDAENFDHDLDSWNVSSVTNMNSMFSKATNFNGLVNAWDVSSVTSMESMFSEASRYNQPLNLWDVDTVINMSQMFFKAETFNQPINDWEVDSVRTMFSMFNGALAFNQDLNSWNVEKVTNMASMFENATEFNGLISDWDVSSVTTMAEMFKGAHVFNRPLNNWNVSSVLTMRSMFSMDTMFNQPLSMWDVDKVKNMNSMFHEAKAFNENINNWNVSMVEDMGYMFESACAFDQPLDGWDVDTVTTMAYMFASACTFNQNISNWDVSAVQNMSYMFDMADMFNQPLEAWDVDTVTDMTGMFQGATKFNQALNEWDVSAVSSIENMFAGAIAFNQPLKDWDLSSVNDLSGMFNGATSFDQALGDWDVSNILDMSSMLNNSGLSIPNFDTLLNKWSIQNVKSFVNFGVQNLRYCNGATGFNDLKNNHRWSMIGASEFCPGEIVLTQTNGSTSTTEEGTTDTVLISLDVLPPSNVVLSISVDDISEGSISKGVFTTEALNKNSQDKGPSASSSILLSYTPQNYSTPQMIIVTGESDMVVDGDIMYGISVDVVDASSAETYDGITETIPVTNIDVPCPDLSSPAPAVTVTNNICAAPGISASEGFISAPSESCPTGSTLMYSLDSMIWDTTLPVYGNQSTQSIYTRCDCDANELGRSFASLSIYEVSPVSKIITAPIICPELLITQSMDTTITNEMGKSDTIMIALTNIEPNNDVVLDIQISDNTEAAISIATPGPTALGTKNQSKSTGTNEGIEMTFTPTNWNVPQKLVVSGLDDDVIDGDITYDLTISVINTRSDDEYDGIIESVKLTNQDDGEPCLGFTPEISSVDVTNSILCGTGTSGEIVINLVGSDLDIEYSIDSGVTWSSNKNFTNLTGAIYEVLARYNDGTLTCPIKTPISTEVKCILSPPVMTDLATAVISGASTVCQGETQSYAFMDSLTMCKTVMVFDPVTMETIPTDSCYMAAVVPDASSYAWFSSTTSGTEVLSLLSPTYDIDFTGEMDSTVITIFITDISGDIYSANKTVHILTQSECEAFRCQQSKHIAASEMLNNEVPSLVTMSESITTTGQVEFNKEFDFRAGDFIELQPLFEVSTGGTFTAQIEECYNSTVTEVIQKGIYKE